jgi:hypothetical protein
MHSLLTPGSATSLWRFHLMCLCARRYHACTHESTTDPDARLFTKSSGSQAKLGYMGHVLMENRNGVLVRTFLTEATGRAERDAAMLMAEAIPPGKRVTLGGDKNYDTQEFVRELRGMNITSHVAQNTSKRRSAVAISEYAVRTRESNAKCHERTMTRKFDVIAIGTGSAASTVASRCREAGWQVAIVDSRPFGGTCALRGCDPKKGSRRSRRSH